MCNNDFGADDESASTWVRVVIATYTGRVTTIFPIVILGAIPDDCQGKPTFFRNIWMSIIRAFLWYHLWCRAGKHAALVWWSFVKTFQGICHVQNIRKKIGNQQSYNVDRWRTFRFLPIRVANCGPRRTRQTKNHSDRQDMTKVCPSANHACRRCATAKLIITKGTAGRVQHEKSWPNQHVAGTWTCRQNKLNNLKKMRVKGSMRTRTHVRPLSILLFILIWFCGWSSLELGGQRTKAKTTQAAT